MHTVVGPVIAPGIAGALGDTDMALQTCEVELQVLLASTQILPLLVPKVTVMVFVPAPAVMLAPPGNVQL